MRYNAPYDLAIRLRIGVRIQRMNEEQIDQLLRERGPFAFDRMFEMMEQVRRRLDRVYEVVEPQTSRMSSTAEPPPQGPSPFVRHDRRRLNRRDLARPVRVAPQRPSSSPARRPRRLSAPSVLRRSCSSAPAKKLWSSCESRHEDVRKTETTSPRINATYWL